MGLPFHQHLFPPVKKLVWEYDMIKNGDKIAVGVSGGKDSLVTLYTLAQLRQMIPVSYSLQAITVDMGWPGADWSPVEGYCRSLGIGSSPTRSIRLGALRRSQAKPRLIWQAAHKNEAPSPGGRDWARFALDALGTGREAGTRGDVFG